MTHVLQKMICILLVLCSLIPLVSCNGEGSQGGMTSESSTEAETVALLDVISNGASSYVLVIPETASEELEAAAIRLKEAILAQTGCNLILKNDFVSWAETAGEYEILIGQTNREEVSVTKGLRTQDFVIRAVGKKLVICGGDEKGTIAAVEYFIANCLGLLSAFPSNYLHRTDGIYPVKSMMLCERSVVDYVMIYPDNAPACKDYAMQLQARISSLCGYVIPIYRESENAQEEAVICFGRTVASECASEDVESDSYSVKASEGKLSILAGSKYAYLNAIASIASHFSTGDTLEIPSSSLTVRFDQPSREEYLADPSGFLPVWSGIWDAGRVLTFEEKITALSNPKNDMMLTIAHRGEHVYYPEQCVESFISCWRAGVSVAEIDLRFTADGVGVLMHDGTLTRMTNYEDVKGTVVNGVQLPMSAEVSAWTYEQLQQLRLKSGSGGTHAALTDYKITTLEEALTVTNGRLFLYIDNKTKLEDLLDWVYPLMKKTGNYRSLLLGGSTLTAQECVEFQKKVKNETGIAPLIYTRASSSQAPSVSLYLKSYAVGGSAILLNGEYFTKNKNAIKNAIKGVNGAVKLGAWTLLEGDEDNATEESWQEMYDLGFRLIMADKIFELQDFAKAKNNLDG